MSATTVKLEAALLRDIQSVKPRNQSLAAYVRDAIERDVMRRRLRASAEEYQAFLREHPDEADEMGAWERSPLAKPPVRRRQ